MCHHNFSEANTKTGAIFLRPIQLTVNNTVYFGVDLAEEIACLLRDILVIYLVFCAERTELGWRT